MTPEQAREIDRQEFEADCRAVRERMHAAIADRRKNYRRWLKSLADKPMIFPKLTMPREPVRRKAQLLTLNGETLPLPEWAKRVNVSEQAIRYRLAHSWTVEQALTPGDNRGRKRTGPHS